MTIRTTAFAALIFVALYNLLFFHTQPGLGTGLLFLFLNIYFFAVRDKNAKNIFWAFLASGFGIIFALLFSFRANGIVQFIDILTAVFFSLVALYFFKFQGNFSFQLANFFILPVITFVFSVGGFFKIFKANTWASNPVSYKSTGSLIRGLMIAVPTMMVLLFLLVSADPIFNKLTQNLFSGIGERSIKSLGIFLALLGFGMAAITRTYQNEKEPMTEGKSYELAVICGAVLTLFAAFILVQFRYLFSSVDERELAQLGINSLTYSEYVRKGFFELLIAAGISCSLLLYVLYYFEYLKDKFRIVVHLFSTILTIETGFLLLSAAKRLALYADAHGLTRARVFGFVFLIWLGILLVIFLVRFLHKLEKKWFFTSVATSTVAIILLVNIINIDGVIATLYKPTVNGETDYYYLANLSHDARDSWQPAIEDAAQTVSSLEGISDFSSEHYRQLYYRQNTLSRLGAKLDYLLHKYGTPEEIAVWKLTEQDFTRRKVIVERQWQSFNLGEYLAYKKIAANFEYFTQVPDLFKKTSETISKISTQVKNSTSLDRSTRPPLTQSTDR